EYRRTRRDTGLAAALDAQRVALGGIFRQRDVEMRKVVRARNGIVEKACRDELARPRLVDRCLQHRLPHALRHAAVYLPMQNEWIDRLAAVVDRSVAADFDGAGLRVDLDLADCGARWIGRNSPGEARLSREPTAQVAGKRGELVGGARDIK